MEKKLIMLGIVDEDGYELDNRTYSRKGVCPTQRAGNARITVIRNYGKETDNFRELWKQSKEE